MRHSDASEAVNRYVGEVLDGDIIAGQFERLACERYVADLEEGRDRGLIFDVEAATHAISFFEFLRHSKGEWAGRRVKLEPWQMFNVWNLFGWHHEENNTRRFRTAYQSVARKNGKTTIAAGIGLYLFDADGEPGAEVYSAATKKDQAKLSHSEATRMVKRSPDLRRRIGIHRDNLFIEATASKFVPLGGDSDTLDGLNVHGAIVDELHAHKTRGVWDVLETATGARSQPMVLGITTAGDHLTGICYEQHDYSERLLSGTAHDDSYFSTIYTIDKDDREDWANPKIWRKANPNLGVSVYPDYLARQAKRAEQMPTALNTFLQLGLNVWVTAATKWLEPSVWRNAAGSVDADALRGRICFGGLDLSSNTDVTAWLMVFPPEIEGDPYKALCRFFVPEDNIRERVKKDRVPYDAWVNQGYITATPGEVIDYDYVYDQIDEDAQRYDIKEIAFDRWGASRVYQKLEKMGLTMVQFGQGFASMSPPMKDLETLILTKLIAHGNNPVLNWMADNLVAATNSAEGIKPDKEKSRERIDGMVALIMGLDRATRHAEEHGSVYDERGIRSI